MQSPSLSEALRLVQSGQNDAAIAVLQALSARAAPHEQAQVATLLGRLLVMANDIDGALDVLIPAWERARRVADPGPAALVGLGLVQALVAADRALHGLRVLVQARSYAELAGQQSFLAAAADLGNELLQRIPSSADAPTAESRAVRAHFRGLAHRATGNLPEMRTSLRAAWEAAADAEAHVRAEVGFDWVHRLVADGHPEWHTVRESARMAAALAGDSELAREFDSIAPPPEPDADDSGTLLERARRRVQAGDADEAMRLCEAQLADASASPGAQLAARCLLAEIRMSVGEPERAAAILAPAWVDAERSGNAQNTAMVGMLLGPVLVADGRTLPGLRVLMVVRHRCAADADVVQAVAEVAENFQRFLPAPETLADAERRALVRAALGLISHLRGDVAGALQHLAGAWEEVDEAGAVARAQVALDYSGTLRATGSDQWHAVHRAGRTAAMAAGDGTLVAMFDAVLPPAEA